MKNILLLSVFTISLLHFSPNLNAQVFKPDSAAVMLSCNLSFHYQPKSESNTMPSSLVLGLSYNKFVAGGLYTGLSFALEGHFNNTSSGNYLLYQPKLGVQAGYFFGKPGQVIYPFAGVFGNFIYTSFMVDGSVNNDDMALGYGPVAGVLFYVHENVGITVQGIYNFSSRLRDDNSVSINLPDRYLRLSFGIAGIFF